MVCMATNGAMAIKGGNWRIFASMLNASSATLHLNTTVSSISKQSDNTYHLTTSSSNHTSTFDEIILAAPLQYTNLTISPAPRHTPDAIPYAELHTTLFASPHRLDPLAFNLAPGAPVPQYVLTTLPATEPPTDSAGSPGFYSISIHNAFTNIHSTPPRLNYIYKIFSPARITPQDLSHFLGHTVTSDDADVDGAVSWIYRKIWYSYPREYPRVTFEEVVLDDGLWYTSGIESLISTMETSALSARNVARLVRDGWVGSGKEEGEKEEWLGEL
jgi:prenylcysteine oxidase/farnesylcysteine lyase